MIAHELIAALNPSSYDWEWSVAATKFDLGELEMVHELSGMTRGEFYEIPADRCMFQVRCESDIYMFLAEKREGHTLWRLFSKQSAHGMQWRGITQDVLIHENGSISATDTETGETVGLESDEDLMRIPDHRAWMLVNVATLARAIEVFSCSNIEQVEHAPPKMINQKRVRKGKTPFYSYRTLHIGGDQPSSERKGSAPGKSSPRLHLRRGHIRRLGDRRIWVSACMVGDKSSGLVMKDYRVTA